MRTEQLLRTDHSALATFVRRIRLRLALAHARTAISVTLAFSHADAHIIHARLHSLLLLHRLPHADRLDPAVHPLHHLVRAHVARRGGRRAAAVAAVGFCVQLLVGSRGILLPFVGHLGCLRVQRLALLAELLLVTVVLGRLDLASELERLARKQLLLGVSCPRADGLCELVPQLREPGDRLLWRAVHVLWRGLRVSETTAFREGDERSSVEDVVENLENVARGDRWR